MSDETWTMTTQRHMWNVTFGLRKDKSTYCVAVHLMTGAKLTAPYDAREIAEIVPFDEWPAFAESLKKTPSVATLNNYSDNPSQESLF